VATELRIPQLAVSMTEGSLVEWYVDDGERVEAGQPLYLLENEKAEVTIESPTTGTLRRIGKSGETYEVGTLVGEIN
jgi:pyruvate/2-oxoglutarate dehydrogenase complex dihydrolipoamide acyltransferase (E2) component